MVQHYGCNMSSKAAHILHWLQLTYLLKVHLFSQTPLLLTLASLKSAQLEHQGRGKRLGSTLEPGVREVVFVRLLGFGNWCWLPAGA